MKKFVLILTSILMTFNICVLNVYAEENEPEIPITEGMNVEEANELIEEYNAKVDEYNLQLEESYQAELEAVALYNQSEDEKVAENEKELAVYEAAMAKVDKHEEKGITETRTTDVEDLPEDFTVTTEASEAKTIKVYEVSEEEKAHKTVKVMNLHIFFDEEVSYEGITPAVIEQLKDSSDIMEHTALAEWETIEVDQNDVITVISEAESMGYKSAAFYKWFEGYTNGYWLPSSTVFSSNAVDTYSDWYKGAAQTASYDCGTTDRRSPADMFSLYTYSFVRTGAEPQKVEKYTPDYKEAPQAPEKLEKLALLEAKEEEPIKEEKIETIVIEEAKTPTAAPQEIIETAPVLKVNTVKEETVEEKAEVIVIEEIADVKIIEEEAPLAEPVIHQGSWALVNLLALIVTILTLAANIPGLFKKEKDGKVYQARNVKYFSLIPAPCALVTFLLTENMKLQMALTDKWTILMLAMMFMAIAFIFIERKEKEEVAEKTAA